MDDYKIAGSMHEDVGTSFDEAVAYHSALNLNQNAYQLENLDSMLNTIYNEDCLEGMKRIPNESMDAIITDPPYGIAKAKAFKSSSHGGFNAIDASWDIFSSKEAYREFSRAWLLEAYRILKPNGSIAVWGSKVSIFDIQPIMESIFPKYLDLLTWIKRDSPPNMTQRGMAPSTEFALIFCKAETGWIFNHNEIKKYNGGKQARNYIDVQRSMPSSERTGHPTQKKIETQQFLVEMLSNQGDVVFDPFVGSGTAIVAAKELKRDYIGFEMSPEYFTIAKKRLNKTRVVP
jgi:DNA modification methylase